MPRSRAPQPRTGKSRPSKVPLTDKHWCGTVGFENYVDFYDLFIFKNKDDYIHSIDKWFRDNDVKEDSAGTYDSRGIYLNKPAKTLEGGKRKVGALFFLTEELTHGMITHECLHAAMEWMTSVNGYRGSYTDDYLFNNSPEEQLAYRLQELVNGIYIFCNQRKIKIKTEKSIYREDEKGQAISA